MSVAKFLQLEFENRRLKNLRYSKNQFAKRIGISPSALSELLSGKRSIGMKTAARIAERLEFSPFEREKFLGECFSKSTRDVQKKQTVLLELDAFAHIADWYHLAILSLGDTKCAKFSVDWVSRRLGIQKREAKAALERLLRMGLLQTDNKTFWQSVGTRTPTEIPSAAIRKYHKQNLEKACVALDDVPVEQRAFGAVTLPVAKKDIAKAKDLIQEFRKRFAAEMKSSTYDEVYTLSVQFFPVSN